MKKLILLLLVVGCSSNVVETTKEPVKQEPVGELKLGKKFKGRFTVYDSPNLKSDRGGKYCLQDTNNKCISKPLNRDKVCYLQMQGSGMVDGVKFSWDKPNRVVQHSCATWGSRGNCSP